MGNLIVANVPVRQDSKGRYCLNDLHKAAGGSPNDKPDNFLRGKAAQDLVAQLGAEYENAINSTSQIRELPVVAPLQINNGGTSPGTYVAKELVYSYAMWVSPSFHLKVIRAYDALVTNQLPACASLESLTPSLVRD